MVATPLPQASYLHSRLRPNSCEKAPTSAPLLPRLAPRRHYWFKFPDLPPLTLSPTGVTIAIGFLSSGMVTARTGMETPSCTTQIPCTHSILSAAARPCTAGSYAQSMVPCPVLLKCVGPIGKINYNCSWRPPRLGSLFSCPYRIARKLPIPSFKGFTDT